MTDALLDAAALEPVSRVLDLAAGSGDPALSIAQRLSGGRVIALDSSRAGLLLANTHARKLGLASKMLCIQGDAHAIPLASNCVDRITCRCGIMFFTDTGLVMSEMLRVLKPGGRVALLAWGPFEQPLFDAMIAPVLRRRPRSRNASRGSHHVPLFLAWFAQARAPGCWFVQCPRGVASGAKNLGRIAAGALDVPARNQHTVSPAFRQHSS